MWFNEANREVEQFLLQWGDELRGEKEISQILDIDLNGIRLRGELGPFIQGRQILFRCVDKISLRIEYEHGSGIFSFRPLQRRGWRRGFTALMKIFRLQPIESVVAQS